MRPPARLANGKLAGPASAIIRRGEISLALAARRAAEARRLLERQYRRIAELKERSRPTFKQEQMLRVLESSVQIFEIEERRLREGRGVPG